MSSDFMTLPRPKHAVGDKVFVAIEVEFNPSTMEINPIGPPVPATIAGYAHNYPTDIRFIDGEWAHTTPIKSDRFDRGFWYSVNFDLEECEAFGVGGLPICTTAPDIDGAVQTITLRSEVVHELQILQFEVDF